MGKMVKMTIEGKLRYVAPALNEIDYMVEVGYAVSELPTGNDGTETFGDGGTLGITYP